VFVGAPLKRVKRNGTWTNNHGRLKTERDCQTLCQNTYGCRWWNWDWNSICWLKTGMGVRLEETTMAQFSGASSGPAHCPHPYEGAHQTEGGWHYDTSTVGGPSDWGFLVDLRCQGDQQSPININTNSVVNVTKGSKATRKLQFTNYTQLEGSDFSLINSGHSLGFKIVEQDPGIGKIEGAGGPLMSASYHLTQGHFHWGSDDTTGSEHTIDGQGSSLELQLFHLRSSLLPHSATSPVDTYDGLVVLSFLFQVVPEDNPNLGFLDSKLSSVIQPGAGDQLAREDLKLWDLIAPALEGAYYTYHGSLTTPPCNQVVQYLVYKEKLPISSTQLALLRRLEDKHGKHIQENLRPVQHVGNRKVYYFH